MADETTEGIAALAFAAASRVDQDREDIMNSIQEAAGLGGDTNISLPTLAEGETIDIAQGAGALLLDDCLQKLSSLEQTAAQTLAAARRGQKEVKQAMG